MYWGAPHYLPYYLRESDISCVEDQVPIETLITIGSKGSGDGTVEKLRSKTSSLLREKIERRIDETKPKLIRRRKKCFNFKDVYFLSLRGLTELISYKYKTSLFALFTIISCALSTCYSFRNDIGEFGDCFALNETKAISCMDMVLADHYVEGNINLIIVAGHFMMIVQCIITLSEKMAKLKVFTNEQQNS